MPEGVPIHQILELAKELYLVSPESAVAFLDHAPVFLSFLSSEEYSDEDILSRVPFTRLPLEKEPEVEETDTTQRIVLTAGWTHYFRGWADQGRQLAKRSPAVAYQYFQSTPPFLNQGEMINVRLWSDWAIQILAVGNESEEAAVTLLRSSPRLLEFMSFRELKDWFALGLLLVRDSSTLASAFFSQVPDSLNSLYRAERLGVFGLIRSMAKTLPNEAVEFYLECLEGLKALSSTVRSTVLELAEKLAEGQPEKISGSFRKILGPLLSFSNPVQQLVTENLDRLAEVSIESGLHFLSHSKRLVSEIPEAFLGQWVDRGLELLAEDERRGNEYFQFISEEPERELSRWKVAVILEEHRDLFSILARAMTGEELSVKSTDSLESSVNFESRRYPTGDGRIIYLPPFSADGSNREENFREYRAATAHQAGYVEYGTYHSGLPMILPILEALTQRNLALDIFFILEDGRIDNALKRDYRGLKRELDLALDAALNNRPRLIMLPLQEALVEALLRLSLQRLDENQVHPVFSKYVSRLKELMAGFYDKPPGVWDCMVKAIEIYEFLSGVPNKKLSGIAADSIQDGPESAEMTYSPMVPIPFRGKINPEQLPEPVQVEIPFQEWFDSQEGVPLSIKDLEELLENIEDIDLLNIVKGSNLSSQGVFFFDREGILAAGEENEPHTEDHESRNRPFVSPASGLRTTGGPYYYDEWDYLAMAYRRNWCCLREKESVLAEPGYINEIYDRHRDLIKKVRREFQRIRPEYLEKVSRVEWGDEIDLNAMIQAVVDRKTGSSPSDKVFSRKEKKTRRISTLLLIDMSASTDERVPCSENFGPDQTGSGSHETAPRAKKIIEIEVESLVVLMEALDALDDEYAIFGFSGYGRERVDCFPIKEFSEPYSENIKQRVGGIEPKQSTRMGPAIRHAISKLKNLESDQRLLILLSDGFPQDHDYGEDRRSYEYALHDTMMALLEAKKEGIRPFCITVDQGGNDYLRKMCDPRNYLVIQDIYSLPEILPKVVESLMA